MEKLPSIGVIGAGFVGGALIRGFAHYTDVKFYDKIKGGDFKEACDQDVIFVAVPTPMEPSGAVNTTIVEEVVADIHDTTQFKPVVLRSTLPPQFFPRVQADFFNNEIIYMPEFLTERTADLDFINATRFIIGTDGGNYKSISDEARKVVELFEGRFPRTRVVLMSWEAASLVKYGTNNFFAVKLSYFNELAKVAKSFGEDSDEVINEILQDGRIGRSHFQVPGHDGDYGWGGHCLPKDNRGYSNFARLQGIITEVADAAWSVNKRVRKNKDWEKMKGRAVS